MPSNKTVSQIRAALLHPATTSYFEVSIGLPAKLTQGEYLAQNGVILNSINKDRLQLMCCEATLPGSNLATLEVTNDFHGVTERHAYRRVYDDRIDLTFYVDAEYYLPIRVFETWIKYIAQESSETPQPERGDITARSREYFYRFQYPDNYMASGLSVTKFERSGVLNKGPRSGFLQYDFIQTYPISIASMPVSYDSSSLLKCTVSMTYIRYLLNKTADPAPSQPTTQSPYIADSPFSAIEQATFNSAPEYFTNSRFGVDTTGGISKGSALSSGNSIEQFEGERIIGAVNANRRPVESGLPYVGRYRELGTGPITPLSGL